MCAFSSDWCSRFVPLLDEAKARDLVSDEHFTVDGTLLEAWASLKSFKTVGAEDQPPPDDPGNPTVNFHGETRTNATHASTTDRRHAGTQRRGERGQTELQRPRAHGEPHGLVVDAVVDLATGTAERDAAFAMAAGIPGDGRVTVGGDKNYDTAELVEQWRGLNVTPHVAQNNKRRRSAIDERTTRHPGYLISQQKRKRVEEIFGWLKTVGGLRKLRHRGLERVAWMFTFGVAAYNLVRMRNLASAQA